MPIESVSRGSLAARDTPEDKRARVNCYLYDDSRTKHIRVIYTVRLQQAPTRAADENTR